MKRSEINLSIKQAIDCFHSNGWALPPNPRWDVTDFSLGKFNEYGLILINLAEEPEYCEKLMYARKHQKTPAHTHKVKKEDIIVRFGVLSVKVWNQEPEAKNRKPFKIKINREQRNVGSGETIELLAGERITLVPGIYHEFWPLSEECIIGEVSTANDDVNDNYFANPEVGRFSELIEDEPAIVKLVNEL